VFLFFVALVHFFFTLTIFQGGLFLGNHPWTVLPSDERGVPCPENPPVSVGEGFMRKHPFPILRQLSAIFRKVSLSLDDSKTTTERLSFYDLALSFRSDFSERNRFSLQAAW